MQENRSQQLVLDVQLSHSPRLDNFICTDKNKALMNLLTQYFKPAHAEQPIVVQARHVFLHGAAAVGKTHLLKSMVYAAQAAQLRAAYITVRELLEQPPTNLVNDLAGVDVVCIDDIDFAAQSQQVQQQLFYLYNHQQERQGHLFFAARDVPDALQLSLKDLASRLNWGLTYRISELDESGLYALFKEHTRQRGIRLEAEVIDYVMLRAQRSTQALMDIIDRLDQASWQTQRAITKPFIKEILIW